MSDVLYPDVKVKLSGQDGNAFAIIGRVQRALREAGHGDAVNSFVNEATDGDYANLLRTAAKYVKIS